MGKRKNKQKAPQKKKQPKLATVFFCPLCNHKDTIKCVINRSESLGTLKCTNCAVHYEARMEAIHEAIDLYSEWIDKTEAVQEAGGDPSKVTGREEEPEQQEQEQEQQFSSSVPVQQSSSSVPVSSSASSKPKQSQLSAAAQALGEALASDDEASSPMASSIFPAAAQ